MQRFALPAVLLVFLACSLTQVALLPAFEGPDEQKHYAYARYLVQSRSLPPIAKSAAEDGYAYGIDQMSGNPPLYYSMVALMTLPVSDADEVAPYLRKNPFVTGSDLYGISGDNHASFLRTSADQFPWSGPGLAVRLGRLVSVAMGLLFIVAVYGALRELIPDWPGAAVFGASIAGLNPQLLFLMSSVTTDAGAIAFSSAALWVALRIVRRGSSPKLVVVGAALVSAALLSKINGITALAALYMALAVSAWLHAAPGRSFRYVLKTVMLCTVIVVTLTAWWFIRGEQMRGDPLGVGIHAYGSWSGDWVSARAWESLPRMLPEFEESLWFRTGWAAWVPPQPWVPATMRVLFGVGWVMFFVSVCGKAIRSNRVVALQVVVLAAAVLTSLGGALAWMLMYQWSLGRLAFPGLSAAACIATLGWRELVVRAADWRWISQLRYRMPRPWLLSYMSIVPAVAATVGGLVTTLTALRPEAAATGIQPDDPGVNATYLAYVDPDDQSRKVAELIGYRTPVGVISTGDIVMIDLCWRGTGYSGHSFAFAVHLVGENDERPASRESYHGLGRRPMELWRPGEVVCDAVPLRVTGDVSRPRAYRVRVALFEFDDRPSNSRTLLTVDGERRAVEPVVGRMRLGPAMATNDQPLASFSDSVVLLDVSSKLTTAREIQIVSRWGARAVPAGDFKIFYHIVDRSTGKILAQSDHDPDGGWFPTSLWQPGDEVKDSVQIMLEEEVMPGQVEVRMGLYDPGNMLRQTAVDNRTGQSLPEDVYVDRP